MPNFTNLFRKITGVALFLVNTIIFFLISYFTLGLFWILEGKNYVYQPPVGGDYFNALTYLAHFAKYLPHPVSGWLPFWNEGISIIESYPPFIFYLIYPLTKSYGLATSMNAFSIVSLALFFIGSLLLFFKISKDWFLASTLVLVEMITQASYYQLTVGGFILSASAQWYLPFVLFFILNFYDNRNFRYLLLASVLTGLSLLHHAPTGILMTLLPSSFVLFFLARGEKLQIKTLYLAIFTSLSISIGSIGIANVLQKTFSGVSADNCASPECWGIYPKHLELWMNPIAPALILSQLIILTVTILFKKKVNLFLILPTLAGLSIIVGFALAAHLKLINGLANVIFPTRTFWAANLFLLMLTASLFASFKKNLHIFSHFFSIIIFSVVLIIILTKPTIVKTDRTNTIPENVSTYILPEFQKNSVSELVPDWILNGEKNWRIDIFSPYLLQWFNIVSEIPATGGYSNKPLGVHQDWLHFLQNSTRRQSQTENQDFVKNRALFMLDAFGIKYIENSIAAFPESVVSDKKIITKNESARDSLWFEVSEDFTSPIITPTNAPALLFVGSNIDYQYFVKVLAMDNINSKVLIPVKSPKDLGGLSQNDLDNFDAIFIYKSPLKNTSLLEKFVASGKSVFIDSDSINMATLSEFLPASSAIKGKLEKNTAYNLEIDPALKIDQNKFSQFEFRGKPWNYTYFENPKSWAKVMLSINNKPVILGGKIGEASIYISGLNLPYHIIDNDNYEESRITNQIIRNLISIVPDANTTYQVSRLRPEEIKIQAENISGIYFKENFDSGWKASIKGKNLKVYKAGLEFMYVPIPNELQENQTININYKGNIVTWSLFIVSSSAIILAFFYLLMPQFVHFVIKKHASFLKRIFGKRVTKLLEDELN